MIGQPVRTEIFYREDIRGVLEGILSASATSPALYRIGFLNAIRAMCKAYNVQISGLGEERERVLRLLQSEIDNA